MIKKVLLSLAMLWLSLTLSASTTWTLQDKEYKVDTVFHAKIGPGTMQTSLELSGAQRLNLFYVTIDLTDPNVDIRVVKAGNKTKSVQTLSTQSNAATVEGAQYFAGVNADFFSDSKPCGSTIVDGKFCNAVANSFDNFWMTADKRPNIGNLYFSGEVSTTDNTKHTLTGVNLGRGENQLILYSSFWGATTETNSYGAECILTPVADALTFGGTAKYRVASAPTTDGNTAIPADGFVLSGHGTAKTFITGLNIGDEVTIATSTAIPTTGVVTQLASGCPVILKDNVTLDTESALTHLTALNPRTAVGYDASRTKLVLLVVDGRGVSVGVISKVLADIMREVGCSDAMNFDGGGSSELYTRTFGVRNKPSDGHERAVTNSVWAVAAAPTDNTIAEIRFMTPVITLPRYAYYTPVIYGYNKYGVLIDTNVQNVTLECDPALGVTVDNDKVLFANGTGLHALTAHYNELTAVIPVTIGGGTPHARLDSVIVDSYRDYKAEVVADVNGTDMFIDNSALKWSSDDASIATVDDTGTIHGVANGRTTVTGTVEDLTASLPVIVEIPTARHSAIEPTNDISKWSHTGVGTKNRTIQYTENNALALTYTISSTRAMSVTLKATQPLAVRALPDSLRLVINPGDATISKVKISAGVNSQRAVDQTYDVAFTPGVANIFEVPVSDFVDVTDFASYPVAFTSVQFTLGDAASSTHTITIDKIDAVYTAIKGGGGVEYIIGTDNQNPAVVSATVLRGEDIILTGDDNTRWTVYEITGSALAQGRGSRIHTGGFSSGLYIVTAATGNHICSSKVLVR